MSKTHQARAVVVGPAAVLVVIFFSLILSNSAQARYCLNSHGHRNCGFSTWQQCQATRHGQGGLCHRKPGT